MNTKTGLSAGFHPKSWWLFSFYFSSIILRSDLLTYGVAAAVFGIAGEMCRLQAYFDNPAKSEWNYWYADNLTLISILYCR